jgi:hypothetical protein
MTPLKQNSSFLNCFISYFIYTKSLPYKFQVEAASKLTLTRPKEPEFETAQRVRSTRVKSTAELEEEMMAKIPKFKARPLNKKVKFMAFFFSLLFTICTFRYDH